MTRKVNVVWVVGNTAATLHAQYRAVPVTEVRTRLHARWLLCQGPTAVTVVVRVVCNTV